MKRPVRSRPMRPASIEASIAAAPNEGPTRRSEIAVSSSGSDPPSISAASSLASADVKLPVMSVDPPRMPTSQPTPVLTSGDVSTSPSRTIAMRRLGSPEGLHAALPVMSAQVSPPLPSKSIATTHSTLCSRWTALAPVTSSPWITVGPTSSVSPWSESRTRLSFLLGSASGSVVDRTSWMVSLAVVPIRSSASWASVSLVTPGSSTRIRFSPWRTRVDSATPSASTRPRRTCSVLSTFSALAGVCSVPSAWKTNCAPPLRSRPRLGLTLRASAAHPARRPSTRKNRTQTPRDMRDILHHQTRTPESGHERSQRTAAAEGSGPGFLPFSSGYRPLQRAGTSPITGYPVIATQDRAPAQASAGVRRQLAGEVGVGPADDEGAVAGVLEGADLGLLVDPVDQVAALVGQQHVELDLRSRQLRLDHGDRLGDALAGLGADHHAVRLAGAQAADHERVGRVCLVDDDDLGDLGGPDLRQHHTDRGDLALRVGVRPVDDVEQQVGVGDLLQRRAERLDQAVGQVADEAHRVGHRVDAAVAGRRTTCGGVERREQRVLHQHAGVGEPV